MGRIRTKDIKDLARDLHEVYSDKLGIDFEENKTVINDLKIVEGKSKKFRNRVAGYTVRLARHRAHGITAVGARASEAAAEELQEEVKEDAAPESEESQAADSDASEEASEATEASEEQPAEAAETKQESSE